MKHENKKMMKGGMAKKGYAKGGKEEYAKGGKGRGRGMAKKGVRPAKMV